MSDDECKSDYSDVNINNLKKQRGVIKSRLTIFVNFINKLDKSCLDAVIITQVRMRMQAASIFFSDFNNIQTKIENNVDEKELLVQLEYRESFESQYYSIIASAKCMINDDEHSESSNFKCTAGKPISVKLPQIKLPAFDGSYDQWLEFRNSYITMIHERQDLDAIQKFHYLKSALSGTALHVISALEFTAPNYSHAWELLENRFHNNRLLVHNHVKSLFTTPSLNKESATQIRKLTDTVLRNLRALSSLKEPTESWDTLIIYLIVTKLDSSTEREWESHKGTLISDSRKDYNALKLEDLLTFLRNRADMLDMIKSSSSKNNNNYNSQSHSKGDSRSSNDYKRNPNAQHTNSYTSNTNKGKSTLDDQNKRNINFTCPLCTGYHRLYSCASFLNMPINERSKIVTSKGLCSNCIRTNSHTIKDCTFGPCKLCQQKHNTLLHTDNVISNTTPRSTINNNTLPQSSVSHSVSESADCKVIDSRRGAFTVNANALQTVLLSTALIEVADSDNNYHTVRALLDNGSQNCFVTENLCKRLNASIIQSTINICGVGEAHTQCNHACKISMRSKLYDFHTDLHCFVLPSITSYLPSINVNHSSICIPNHVQLADPSFNVPSKIDVLIGADVFWSLILEHKIIRLKSGPCLQGTSLGWIISGPVYNKRSHINTVQCNFSQVDSQLRKFWEIEEINIPRVLSEEERLCEKLFIETTQRDNHGRFHVKMPLKQSPDVLGDSYNSAKNRFYSLERKLERLPQYKQMYCNFMQEYEQLGHMSLLAGIQTLPKPCYVMPHHGVYRENSLTTKLRVVFDGSATTTSNKSLNDLQYVGPAIQNDIFSILLRFRQYQYVACADVEKMYRQVLIQADQRNLQLILWRNNSNEPLQVYRLNTVTYGTTSAPYLSIRCLKQLAQECDDDVIASVINDDFYVDDLITGHDELNVLLDICSKTSKVLQSGCFPLRKWTFNHDVTPETCKDLSIGEHCQSKTLGIGWSNKNDTLYFTTNLESHKNDTLITKRLIMSIISQIYDPLGLVAPAITTAKILLQQLWLSKLDWDDEVPVNIANDWHKFMNSVKYLPEIIIPRCVVVKCQHKELHIFSDASQVAYGACAYVRSFDNTNSNITTRLLCAKGKVAPIKTVSIPRLELCGALIGAQLYQKVIKSLRLTFEKVYFWTDSTIVQGWLRMSPHQLKTFVQNRVVQINELTGNTIWRHVKGKENPADLLSRGVYFNSFKEDNIDLWWYGPRFLCEPTSSWSTPIIPDHSIHLPDVKPQTINLISTDSNSVINFDRFSCFNRLQRTCTYVIRFLHNARASRNGKPRRSGVLTVDEIASSLQVIIRLVQQQSFHNEYNNLIRNLPVKYKYEKRFNKISGLNIFLDTDNIIRVGGRLCNSQFNYNKKHPVLLCHKHRFTVLLCTYEHKRLLHAGPQLLVSTLRDTWWVLGARNLAKYVVHKCVTCTRLKGKTLTPLMGSLPSERLEPTYPFMKCGVDYAGPVLILNRKGRGSRLIKAYICLFICFTTRAVHLELVSTLSTQDYILALKRFISRRGKPYQIFSDNGKNFVGAEKELSAVFDNTKDILEFASNNNIKFLFIPPYAPHFGGLWEAGIKSCKHHLRRVVGDAKLTFEEFSTILTQIEAVLNSRPMSPLSTDPNDFLPLTPAHFLIGRPLTAHASEDLTQATPTRLGRYERLEQLRQHFWERWSKEYVSELQRRTKWVATKDDIACNSLVLIKEDNLPPLKWRMGRVIRVFAGTDGISRVAEIRTASGVIRRACSKICPLPVDSE